MEIRRLGLAGLALAALSAAVILLFQTSSWAPAAPGFAVVWALPVCFGLHVFEEFGFPGGFGEWSMRHRPRTASAMTPAHFWQVNVIGGLAAVGVALAALDYAGGYSYFGARIWLVLLCTLGVNAASHIAGTVRSQSYSPGLITSVALYLPLLVLGAGYFLARVVDPLSALLFVAIGVAAYFFLIGRLRTAAAKQTSA